MKDVIGEWIGKTVTVMLSSSPPIPVKGTLIQADESGVFLQMPKGKTFIPVTSILHISLVDGS